MIFTKKLSSLCYCHSQIDIIFPYRATDLHLFVNLHNSKGYVLHKQTVFNLD